MLLLPACAVSVNHNIYFTFSVGHTNSVNTNALPLSYINCSSKLVILWCCQYQLYQIIYIHLIFSVHVTIMCYTGCNWKVQANLGNSSTYQNKKMSTSCIWKHLICYNWKNTIVMFYTWKNTIVMYSSFISSVLYEMFSMTPVTTNG
jgi:hypothetical protein